MKLRVFFASVFALAFGLVQATVHSVSVGSNFFNPNALTITAGDTVLWTNTGGNHNVNGSTATFPSNPASFGNGAASSAAWSYQFQFTMPGTYSYQCDPHAPGMAGTVTVNAAPASASDLRFTEIMYNVPSTDSLEYIEIFNNEGSTVNLNGYTFSEGVTYTFPSINLAAGAYLLVCNDSGAFFNTYGISAYQWTSGALSNSGEDIVLKDNNGATVDSVDYDDGGAWNSQADGNGPSLVLCDLTLDPNLGSSWLVSADAVSGVIISGIQLYGSPGAADLACSLTPAPIPSYSISSVTTVDAQGVLDSIGVACKLVGLVSSPNYIASGVQFTLTDAGNTSGIVVRNTSFAGYTPTMGDELRVIGTLSQFRGLAQLNVDSIVVLSSGNTLPAPSVETSLGEGTENRIIRLNGMMLVNNSNWGNGNNDVYFPGGGDTVTLRFDTDFSVNWGTAPTGAFDVIGVGGQFNSSSSAPFDNGYQIFPRMASDIIPAAVIGAGGIPNYNITQLTGVDALGVADSIGVEARIHAVVYTDDFDGNNGYSFYVYDATGGINVFSFNDVGTYSVTRGDSLRLIGTIDQFNGLTQFEPDSIVVLAQGVSLKMPTVVTDLDETTESEYIRLNGFTVVNASQWPTTPSTSSGVNVDITDGSVTLIMRIDSDTDINGTPAPTGAFDVIGAGGQFDNSSPFDAGYQIFPRDLLDIIPVVPATPTVNFPLAAQSQLEDAGTVTVNLPIVPASPNAETIKIYVSNGAGITAADYTTAPAPANDTITLNVPASASSVSFDVIITDDAMQEADEDITLTLANVSAGLTIGSINTHVFTIQDNDTPIPTYDISQIVGVNAQGEMDSAGVYCKIVATVTSPQLSATRTDFFITNAVNTAGIKVNQSGLIAYNAVVGDEIRVVGTLSQFRGGIQISADTLVVLNSGNPIQPVVFNQNLGENTEGRVLRLNGVELVDTTGWPSVNFGNFDIVLTTGDTVTLRLDSDIPTLWGPPPVGTFDVIGVAGQFSSSSSAPFDDGYQILPRAAEEIIVNLPTLAITEVMPSSNLTGAIGGDWFELTNFGPDPISLNGFSWDDESRTSGTHTIATVASFVIDAGQSIIFYEGVTPDDSAWAYEWSQWANNIVVVAEDDFGGIGFSGLSSSGDEVNFYDNLGQLVSRATYTGADVTAGVSIVFDTTGTLVGSSQVNVDGAYASAGGDVGSPGNMTPISIAEFLLRDMSLYPNPAQAVVKLTSATNASKQITVRDLSGREVMQLNDTDTVIELNVSTLPKGVYLIEVSLEGVSATRKLIVQ